MRKASQEDFGRTNSKKPSGSYQKDSGNNSNKSQVAKTDNLNIEMIKTANNWDTAYKC